MLSRPPSPGSQKIAASVVFVLFAVVLAVCFQQYPRGTKLPEVLAVFGKFHPLFLHLPIGLLLGAVALDVGNGPLRRHDAAVTLLLWLGYLSGIAAVLAGYFLGVPGGYAQETLDRHLWSGISIPVLTFLTILGKLHHQQKQPLMSSSLYRAPLYTTAAALMVAGHFGGSMSHGNVLDDVRRLLNPIQTAAAPATAGAGLTVYDAVIAPLMEQKCISCHGPEKSKGDLQLQTHAAMLLAGESGKPATVPGKSAESEAVLRILLPPGNEEHMPPDNKPQITADELAVLQWWIDQGASPDLKIGDPQIPGTIAEKISLLLKAPMIVDGPGAQGEAGPAGPAGPSGEAAPAPDAAPVLALEKELGVAILPLAQNDPALSFNCVNVADKFGDGELAKFAPIASRMSEMNLGRSKVTDAGMASLAGMTSLKKLHLPNTAITDAGLDPLLALTNLEYLNLFNTKITDAGLAKLEKLPNLKRLYVWQTGATKPAAEALHAKLPNIVINLGWDQEVKTAALPAPAEPAVAAAAAPAAMDPEKPVYETLIHPIFAAKCIGCHGEDKAKGKLKMHTFAELMKNGDSGEAAVVAGKSGDSLIIKRALLPLEEDEHMPPSNKDQLTEKELATLKWWIDAGANTEIKLKDAGLPDQLK